MSTDTKNQSNQMHQKNNSSDYKMTEIGLIPRDWEVKSIRDFALVKTGNTPPTNDKTNYGDEFFFVSPADLGKGKYILETEKKLSEKGFSISRQFPNQSILFTCIGSTIGKSGIANKALTSNQQINAILPNELYNSDFVFYVLNILSPIIKSSASEQAVPLINKSQFESFQIPFPTKSEQTAIATALSDADNYTSSLEKLIAKKRLLKQGAMQQLLRPKEDWVVKKLGEVADVLDNLRVPLNDNQRATMKGDIPYCGANGIVDYVNDFVIDDDIILMAEDGGYFDEYKTRPIAYRMTGKCWVNNHAHILKAKSENDQGFLFYSLVHKNILDFINGGTRAKLNKGELVNIEVTIPKVKAEQTRIATILSDMDADIAALEKQLAKARSIKQGMMQQLLTGKIRLNYDL